MHNGPDLTYGYTTIAGVPHDIDSLQFSPSGTRLKNWNSLPYPSTNAVWDDEAKTCRRLRCA